MSLGGGRRTDATPFNARGQWSDRGITRPVPPPGVLHGQAAFERASGAANGLARRVREMSEHLDHTAEALA